MFEIRSQRMLPGNRPAFSLSKENEVVWSDSDKVTCSVMRSKTAHPRNVHFLVRVV